MSLARTLRRLLNKGKNLRSTKRKVHFESFLFRGFFPNGSASSGAPTANHASHGDFVLIWTVLPPLQRARTRPVAARDYWDRSGLRGFLIHRVFRGVLVERGGDPRAKDPLVPLIAALNRGVSIIIFPDGTRNTEEQMLPFKSGIFHLARQRPNVDLVPVWIENVGRVMGKGQFVPVPLLCSVTFGAPLRLAAGEEKQALLDRARQAIVDLQNR